MRLTQNNSVTVMQTIRRNPSMQNRTILIQCDRALSKMCNFKSATAAKVQRGRYYNRLRDRIINSHFAGKLNSFNMGGRGVTLGLR